MNQDSRWQFSWRNLRTLRHHPWRSWHHIWNRLAACTQPRSRLGPTIDHIFKMPQHLHFVEKTPGYYIQETTDTYYIYQCTPPRRGRSSISRTNLQSWCPRTILVHPQFRQVWWYRYQIKVYHEYQDCDWKQTPCHIHGTYSSPVPQVLQSLQWTSIPLSIRSPSMGPCYRLKTRCQHV